MHRESVEWRKLSPWQEGWVGARAAGVHASRESRALTACRPRVHWPRAGSRRRPSGAADPRPPLTAALRHMQRRPTGPHLQPDVPPRHDHGAPQPQPRAAGDVDCEARAGGAGVGTAAEGEHAGSRAADILGRQAGRHTRPALRAPSSPERAPNNKNPRKIQVALQPTPRVTRSSRPAVVQKKGSANGACTRVALQPQHALADHVP